MDFQYAVELADEHGTVLARCTMRMLDQRVGRLIVDDLLGPLPDGEYLLRSGGREIDARWRRSSGWAPMRASRGCTGRSARVDTMLTHR